MNRQDKDRSAPTLLPVPASATAKEMVRRVDPWIAGPTVVLLAIGTIMVYSASAVRAYAETGDSSFYLVRHLISILIGLAALGVALRLPIERYSRFAYPLLILTVALLIAVLLPGLGRRVNGAVRWLTLGPLSFQPSEFAKLAVIIYLAHSLAKKREKVSTFSVGFLPHVAVTSLVAGLVLVQPDLGTGALLYALLGVMMFVAGTRISYLILAIVFALPVAYHYVATRPHAWARMLVFLNPEAYKRDIGYQIWESLVSFGSGGAFGLGLGAGRQKLYFLPESHTDFVFAVLGQELGFLGVVVVLLLFLILVARGLRVAIRSTCRFPMFLAVGISAWIGIQALTNMAVVVALVPTKGLTLPLISFGRSSVVVTLFAIGILLRLTAEQACSLLPEAQGSASRKRRAA